MPRGVSRKKHPELYKDGGGSTATSTKTRGRRVKTGGRGRMVTRSAKSWIGEKVGAQNFGQFGELYNLASIREKLCAGGGKVNQELLSKFDTLIVHQIDDITNQGKVAEQPMQTGAIVERQGSQAQPPFNPPPPGGGQYQGARATS